jgi:uncharacterized membrane protein
MNDTNIRSIAKALSWRITGSGATFIIAYLMTGNFAIASAIGIVQLVCNTFLYYIHERLWNKFNWGKE